MFSFFLLKPFNVHIGYFNFLLNLIIEVNPFGFYTLYAVSEIIKKNVLITSRYAIYKACAMKI